MTVKIARPVVVAFVLAVALFVNHTPAETVDMRSTADPQPQPEASPLREKTWIHGAADCEASSDPAIEVYRADPSSYILRQSKYCS